VGEARRQRARTGVTMRTNRVQSTVAGRGDALRQIAAAGLLLALAGCASTDGVGLGAPLSATGLAAPQDGGESIASEKIEALLGAGFGGGLGPGDLAAAYRAQTRALDQSRAGTSVTWANPATGNKGEIVPGPVYIVNNLECRDFSHAVETSAGREVRRGAACRRADGSWQAIA
jgi:surface antigen